MDGALCKMRRYVENALNRATIIFLLYSFCVHVVGGQLPQLSSCENCSFSFLEKRHIWTANNCMQY